mmetsp:Transcript_38/g.78  ORF Transcript_38/g.78 Transcript_38/m.78 type:complete len:261 (+) Transcript_38:23-805(+)
MTRPRAPTRTMMLLYILGVTLLALPVQGTETNNEIAVPDGSIVVEDLGKDLKVAVRMDWIDQVQEAVEANPEVVLWREPDGWTLLLHAADAAKPQMAAYLLEQGANPNIARNDGFTPLMFAADSGSASMTKALLRAGADVSMTNEYGETALIIARNLQEDGVIKQLAKYSVPNEEMTTADIDKWMQHHTWKLQRIISGGFLEDLTVEELQKDYPELPHDAAAAVLTRLVELQNSRGHLFEDLYQNTDEDPGTMQLDDGEL